MAHLGYRLSDKIVRTLRLEDRDDVYHMARNWTVLIWRPATQIFGGAIGLILLSLVCFRTGLSLAPTGMAFLVLIASLSLTGNFIGSFVLSVVAVGLLNYYFTEPLFEFRIEYPQDILFLVSFLAASVIVTRLVARLQRGVETSRENEDRFRDYVDVASDWFWETGPDHRFTEFSRSAADWGLSQQFHREKTLGLGRMIARKSRKSGALT